MKSNPNISEPKFPAVESELVAAPKDYFLGPVFAATRQTGPREVTIGKRRYQIGGFHPMSAAIRPPALDVRHARAIFSLLSFRDPSSNSALIRFSFNELCMKYARSNGGRYARAIAEIVRELMDAYIRVTNLETGIAHVYRLIERIDIEERPIRRKDAKLAKSGQRELWFNGCTLSPEFCGLLHRVSELQHLRLTVFTSIRSPLAQAIYLYIPSRAHHHEQNRPFEINVSKLLEQVSFPLPPHKSVRRKIFCQHAEHGRSIMQQLDGLETLSGRFRVSLTETEDGSDWKLQAWIERPKRTNVLGNSKLTTAYLKSGRSKESLQGALKDIQSLSDYELELLSAAGAEVGKNRRFLEMAKALLRGPQFVSLLSEAKGEMLEGRKATKNPTARLIHRIMEAVATPVR